MFEAYKSPYSLVDSVKWAYRYLRGGNRDNPQKLPHRLLDWTHGSEEDREQIIFIGDLMGTCRKKLRFGPNIMEYFHSATRVFANLEGPLVNSTDRVFIKQYNSPKILEDLNQLAPMAKWVFGLANNHIFDYGLMGVEQTLFRITEAGAQFFGVKERPYYRENCWEVYAAHRN